MGYTKRINASSLKIKTPLNKVPIGDLGAYDTQLHKNRLSQFVEK